MLTSLMVVELGGQEIAIQAAKNFRALRRLGVTVCKTIDSVIATRCIESGYDLLHNDRDFDPFGVIADNLINLGKHLVPTLA
jgi:predicted nucleic acid-binding protein